MHKAAWLRLSNFGLSQYLQATADRGVIPPYISLERTQEMATKSRTAAKAKNPLKPRLISLRKAPCDSPCTSVIRFLTDHEMPANVGISIPPYTKVDGYRHLNLFVRFSQETATEPPVDLGVIFAFDTSGKMGARRYVNLEENVAAPQGTNMISVSGSGTWHGSPHNISSYVARFPVLGPYVEVFVYNQAPDPRTVSVWGYLVS